MRATRVALELLWEGEVLGSLSAKDGVAELLGPQNTSLHRRQSETEPSLGTGWGRDAGLGSGLRGSFSPKSMQGAG